jgi:hypothetical protein
MMIFYVFMLEARESDILQIVRLFCTLWISIRGVRGNLDYGEL